MMATTATTKRHFPPPPTPPTFSFLTRFLFKSILIALFLLLLPLFPSQAPDFFNQSLFTKFWELLHLLFIGIAVSYGLFGRRNMDKQAQPNDVVDNSQSYISRINNFMSFCEEGYENPSGYELEHDLSRDSGLRTSRKPQGEFVTNFIEEREDKRFDFNKQNGPAESFHFEINDNDVEVVPSGDKGVVSSWNSQYFQCEPMVVVSKPNYSLGDEFVKPLGLPVRSLKSRVAPKFSSSRSRIGSSSSSNGSGDGKNVTLGEFEFHELGPGHLEKTFEETESVSMPSPIPWGLRSGRIERRDSASSSANEKQYLHSRHLSVEVPQVRSQSSKSFRCMPSSASQVGSVSSSSPSPMAVSPSHTASLDVKMEELGTKKSSPDSSLTGSALEEDVDSLAGSLSLNYKGMTKKDPGRKLGSRKGYVENGVYASCEDRGVLCSSTDCGHSLTSSNSVINRKVEPLSLNDGSSGWKNRSWDLSDGKASLSRSQSHCHSRSRTFGSFPEKIGQRSLKNDLEELKWSKREELSYSRRVYRDSSKLDVKPCGNSHDMKSSGRGKSVRTFRASERKPEVDEGEVSEDFIDKKVRGKQEHVEYMEKEGEIRGCPDKEYSGSSQESICKSSSILEKESKMEFSTDDGEVNLFDGLSIGSEKKATAPAGESENLNVDEEAMSDTLSVAGTECNEVDKKASEFIAKFREQIRLQKMASMEFSRELDLSELHMR